MDDNTKRALRNIAIFAGFKLAMLYGIRKTLIWALEDETKNK